MSLSPAVLYPGGQLGTGASTLYTSPVNAKTLITAGTFTNIDAVSRLLTVYLVRAGGSPSAANTLIDGLALASGQAYIASELEQQVLGPGDFIAALADASSAITCPGISGYLVT